jgi:GNAT superfamily N-acetyltransferase
MIRAAAPGDLDGILALYRELRPHDPELSPAAARDAFAGLLGRDDIALLVCDAGGTLAATCMLAVIPNLASGARPFGIIEHVVTLHTHRRRGFARQVLEHALSIAWARRCCKVVLLSGAQRAGAHRLYESVGFVGDVERGFVARPLRLP